MPHKKQFERLGEEIETILSPLSNESGLFEILKEPLSRVARGLAPESKSSPWPLLPMIVCEAISGGYEPAVTVAAALQLLLAAGDVFDDIEDADSPESLSSKYGNAVATNAATTLLILAERALPGLKQKGVADCLIVRVMQEVNSFYAKACVGQHLDINLSLGKTPSEEFYLKIIGMKSASQIQCACHVGALLSGASQEVVEIFSAFGYNLGMAAQITNDVRGITGGKDILKPKLTLPVIYALTHTKGQLKTQLENVFLESPPLDIHTEMIKDIIFRSGAVHYATIKIELFKQQSLDILDQAKRRGAKVEQLRIFLT